MGDKSIRTFNITTLLMLAVFLLYGLFAIIWGEVMSFENGFAWDAATYRNVTSDFISQVFGHNLNVYSIQRILPPGLIHFIFKIFNVAYNDTNIVTAFRILNLVSILFSILFFNLISNELHFKKEVKWLGFFGIFVNYAFIRQSFYYPVHTDTTAFALGMALLYFYTRKNYTAMFLTTFAGMFTWPSFIYASLPLYAFPYEDNHKHAAAGKKSKSMTIIFIIFIAVSIIYLYYVNKYYTKIFTGVAPPDHSLVPLSILCLLAYVYFTFGKITDDSELYNLRMLLKKLQLKYLIVWILFFVCVIAFGKIFASKTAAPETVKSLAGSFLTFAITEPLINLISHIIYFGPFLLLTVFFWNKYCKEIHSHGTGLILFVIFVLLFSIGSESRRFINLMPVIFIFTAKVLNEFEVRRWHVIIFGIFSFAFSKIWFKMNTEAFPPDIRTFQNFPWQNYFMNLGPWISHEMYLVQGCAVLITGVILYFIFARNLKVFRNKESY